MEQNLTRPPMYLSHICSAVVPKPLWYPPAAMVLAVVAKSKVSRRSHAVETAAAAGAWQPRESPQTPAARTPVATSRLAQMT